MLSGLFLGGLFLDDLGLSSLFLNGLFGELELCDLAFGDRDGLDLSLLLSELEFLGPGNLLLLNRSGLFLSGLFLDDLFLSDLDLCVLDIFVFEVSQLNQRAVRRASNLLIDIAQQRGDLVFFLGGSRQL